MFHGLFGYDNAISKFFRTIGNIWYLHILWLVTSLPVITVGASTTALLYSMMKLHEEDGYPTENFFHSFKLNFRQATGLYLIYLAVGAVIAADLVIANQMMGDGGKGFWIVSLIVAVPYVLGLLYVFAVEARFVNSIPATIRYAFGLSIRHFGDTFQMLILIALVIYANTTLVICNFLTLSFGVGLIAYILTFYYNRIFKRYIPKEETGDDTAWDSPA
ncbi:MAG: DUF624 domain-containing protein [Butyrivibrio sp.]|jgi:uncharacterized membrane protein YesL|nr:DUF624 domain-containing protein [Butyrivibrio sp.]